MNERAPSGHFRTTAPAPPGHVRWDLLTAKGKNLRSRYRIWHDGTSETGQALVEYALIIGLASLVSILLLSVMGTDISGLLAKVTVAMESAV